MADERIRGCLMGIAVGDSIGLPFEGLSRKRVSRRLGGKRLRQSFLRGLGMLSDDTEQSCMVLEAYRASGGDVRTFQSRFAKSLRKWFLALPAGVGLATAKASLKLVFGASPQRSGVNSAGNGGAMRSPILGALIAEDPEKLLAFVEASSTVTHTDPRAIDAAWAMACAVTMAGEDVSIDELLAAIGARCRSEEWRAVLQLIARSLSTHSPEEFAEAIGCAQKVSGFAMHSVPMVLFIWLQIPHRPEEGITTIVRLGGDTDTNAAMLASLYGTALGDEAFPEDWVAGIRDWPRSIRYLERLSDSGAKPPRILWVASLVRNGFFLAAVLAHGLRRLLP